MAKYIKLFQTHSEYETYITDSDKILPNVSYCKDNNEVHYNPWTDPRLIAKFNVEDVSKPVAIYGYDYGAIASDLFSKIEIDGEEISISELEGNEGHYTFDTTGEHTVKYTLLDPTSIGDIAFEECSSLTSIEIPNSITSIGNDAFAICTGLTSITIPSNVITIGNGAFRDCNGLTSINIPSSVTSISAYAFSGCSGLTSITIPNSVTSIGDSAFYACRGLTSISVESGNTVYDSRNNCNAIIETATNTLLYGCQNTIIPSDVTSIGNNAFRDCTRLTSINIPSSVTSIGVSAFNSCSGLTSINIPSSVTSIGNSAFAYCSSLTNITIPSGVTSIGDGAFNSCSGLNSITSLATTAPTIKSTTFLNVKTGGTLYVPIGSTGYNVWMRTGNFYLGKYGWTKVEQ